MNRSKSILLMLLLLGGAAGSQARVRRIEITRIESPTFEGMSFGRVGQYEKLVGRVFGEVNPNDPIDSQITDIALAPRDSSGLVEYSADIVRTRYEDPPQTVPGESWEYTDASLTAIKLLPNGTPFERGTLYEFTYQAKDPLVAGLGLAAIRDVPAFLHHAPTDDDGNPNPLAGHLHSVYSYCISQPCRALHDFLWLGFNQDDHGRRVFDGMLNWIGGGNGDFLNYRFAQPGRTHRQHVARWYPEFQFPFAYQTLFDPNTGKTDGRLRRCAETNTCPKILEVNSENEYWAKARSVLHLDPFGNDLSDPPNVRYYLMSSLPHNPGVGPTGPGICQQNRNPLVANPVMRALLVDLDEWVSRRREPPATRLPRAMNGTLVPSLPQSGVGFPEIPGVVYNGRIHTGDLFDFGSLFDHGILTTLPPILLGTPYPALVPKTDADGNDIAGIRLPEVAVPLATYTGWGLRAFPPGANEGWHAAGQKIDFAATKAERVGNGDPRLSIEERYANHDEYVSAVAHAAFELRRQRLLLDDDVLAYIVGAAESDVRK